MTARLDPMAAAPDLMKAWLRTSMTIASSLEPTLVALVEIRASQINGCANCINLHTVQAREKGEAEQRIYLLSAWREAPCYTDRERAALGWTDALTRLSEGHELEGAYEDLTAHFTEEERVKLTLMINIINGWNRIAVGFGVICRSGGRQGNRGGGRRLMAGAGHEDAAASFDPLRPKLMRVAYRMLGSVADAEDVLQEAFIRWMGAERSEVREPEAFLRRTVTRLCLDQLKSARRQRETYIGPWLPDPVVEEEEEEDVTLPLMLALERLSPLERAAFLLHDVFGLEFEEVATTIQRDPAACRQLAARARSHVREARPRFQVEKQHGLEIANAFFTASRGGDMEALAKMLATDVSAHTDGGGKRPAVLKPIVGFAAVMEAHEKLAVLFKHRSSKLIRAGFVNGLPGFITLEADGEFQTTALEIEDGKVAAIYVVRNPDKLRHLH